MVNNFGVLILSNGRPNKIPTIKSLRDCGYTGPIHIVCDDLDPDLDTYKELHGDAVTVFDKMEWAKKTDSFDNYHRTDSVVYARNAAYPIACGLGFRYFAMMDDDYTRFDFRFDSGLKWYPSAIKVETLDAVFESMVGFLSATNIKTVAMSQGGDFIGGGSGSPNAKSIHLSRKAMNTFVCDTERPIEWVSRLNDDVNTYVGGTVRGETYFTTNQISVTQKVTQESAGGLTRMYLDFGTYAKSFRTLMLHPSGTSIRCIGHSGTRRMHHSIDWGATAPKIIREENRKGVDV